MKTRTKLKIAASFLPIWLLLGNWHAGHVQEHGMGMTLLTMSYQDPSVAPISERGKYVEFAKQDLETGWEMFVGYNFLAVLGMGILYLPVRTIRNAVRGNQ